MCTDPWHYCEMDNLWAGRPEVAQWLRCSSHAKGRILIPCHEARERSLLPALMGQPGVGQPWAGTSPGYLTTSSPFLFLSLCFSLFHLIILQQRQCILLGFCFLHAALSCYVKPSGGRLGKSHSSTWLQLSATT